jgi:hypothetical protein
MIVRCPTTGINQIRPATFTRPRRIATGINREPDNEKRIFSKSPRDSEEASPTLKIGDVRNGGLRTRHFDRKINPLSRLQMLRTAPSREERGPKSGTAARRTPPSEPHARFAPPGPGVRSSESDDCVTSREIGRTIPSDGSRSPAREGWAARRGGNDPSGRRGCMTWCKEEAHEDITGHMGVDLALMDRCWRSGDGG